MTTHPIPPVSAIRFPFRIKCPRSNTNSTAPIHRPFRTRSVPFSYTNSTVIRYTACFCFDSARPEAKTIPMYYNDYHESIANCFLPDTIILH
jgi:hypothetical protein